MTEFDEQDHTRHRILHAALAIFAERGFKAATVREICAQAGVNVASVNYHFRSKEALYREALAFAFEEAERKYPQTAFTDVSLPPAERLRQFIRTLLLRLLDDGQLGIHARLMAREIADPTEALDLIIDPVMRQRFLILQDLVRQLAGPHWAQADIDRFIHNIIGQCLVYRHSRPMVERMSPDIIASPAAIDRTADLIHQFSLAALQHLGKPAEVPA